MVWNKKKKAQAQKKRSRELRNNSSKRNVRQRYSSIANAIAATAPEATPLFSPHTAPPSPPHTGSATAADRATTLKYLNSFIYLHTPHSKQTIILKLSNMKT